MADWKWEDFKVDVPEGIVGKYQIKKFTVSKEDEDFGRMRAILSSSSRGRFCPAGTYTALKRIGDRRGTVLKTDSNSELAGTVVMSDTHDEIMYHIMAIQKAKGEILINGLGLGVVLNGCLNKPEVTHATVVEISQDVIDLVGPHYMKKFGDRLTIVHANAFDYKPPKGVRYGMVWHDIWDTICSENYDEMKKLHRKYGKICDWQWSWCRELCLRDRR
jgi:hypothetical protein